MTIQMQTIGPWSPLKMDHRATHQVFGNGAVHFEFHGWTISVASDSDSVQGWCVGKEMIRVDCYGNVVSGIVEVQQKIKDML